MWGSLELHQIHDPVSPGYVWRSLELHQIHDPVSPGYVWRSLELHQIHDPVSPGNVWRSLELHQIHEMILPLHLQLLQAHKTVIFCHFIQRQLHSRLLCYLWVLQKITILLQTLAANNTMLNLLHDTKSAKHTVTPQVRASNIWQTFHLCHCNC